MLGDLDGCYETCRDDDACNIFLFDPNDGECLREESNGSDCPAPYLSTPYYMMYQINHTLPPTDEEVAEREEAETTPPSNEESSPPSNEEPTPAPGADLTLPYVQIGEFEECSNSNHIRYGFYWGDLNLCFETCRDDETCDVFLFDPNDGECLKEDLGGESCNLSESWYYMVYEITQEEGEEASRDESSEEEEEVAPTRRQRRQGGQGRQGRRL